MPSNDPVLNDLKQQVDTLSKKVQELQNDRALRRDFLAHIAHELRTPLNTIIGFAQILDRHTTLSAEQSEYLTLILHSCDQLLSLINDILQMSKLESGEITLNLVEVDLLKLVEIVESIYGAEAKEKNLRFEVSVAEDLPRYIIGDESKIRQILSNLLSNAIKFTQEGSISLRIFPEYNYDDIRLRVVFSVTDTGQGIKDTELTKLFKPYQQTTSGEKAMTGTGLGLAITRELIDLMNGEIQVDSKWGKGTTFSATIEVERVYKQADEVELEQNIVSFGLEPNNYRILIVDDNKNNRDLLQKLLTRVRFEVKLAETGLQATEMFQSWQPDLILMDMRMPVMNGADAIEQIRTVAPDSDVIIIALTADAFLPGADIKLPSGCDDYILKPFRISNLLEKIGKHLELTPIYNTQLDQSTSEHSQTVEQELAIISRELMQRLDEAVSTYSIERIQSILDELPSNLAKFISDSLEEFDFAKISNLLNKHTR